MRKYLALFSFGVLYFANAAPVIACSPPPPEFPSDSASVSSLVPAKNVPKGVIQLKVEAPDYGNIRDDKMTLRVKQVINGKFSEPTIFLNASNVSNCGSSFEPLAGDFFISVLPMEYADGEPVMDRGGKQEFGALFYKYPSFYDEPPEDGTSPDKGNAPQFAEYMPMTESDFSFDDAVKLDCLFKRGDNPDNLSADTWRQCVKPGENVTLDCVRTKEGKFVCEEYENTFDNRPPELRRGYSFWVHHRTTMFLILLALGVLVGLGYFLRRRKLRTS